MKRTNSKEIMVCYGGDMSPLNFLRLVEGYCHSSKLVKSSPIKVSVFEDEPDLLESIKLTIELYASPEVRNRISYVKYKSPGKLFAQGNPVHAVKLDENENICMFNLFN